MKNWILMLFSLLVAILLNAFVNSEGNSSLVELLVPVELRDLPSGKIVIAPRERQVRVYIKGPTSLVTRIAASPPIFKINLPTEIPNRFVAVLRAENLSLPPYVHVQKIAPSEIEFTFDDLVERTLPIAVPKIGTLSPSLNLESLTARPSTVQVRGPKTEISNLANLESFPVDLRDIKGSFEREVSIRLPGPFSELTPSVVTILGTVISTEKRVIYSNIPIEVRSGAGKNVKLDPNTVQVTVSGPSALVDSLKREDVVPFVRLKGGQKQQDGALVDIEIQLEGLNAEISPQSAVVTNMKGR